MSTPWMPFYVADYLADTAHLCTLQHGAYMLLIMHYWRRGGLPDDDAQLAQICRMTPESFALAKPILQGLFYDGWRHKRIDEEIAEAKKKHKKRVNAGVLGGRPKQNISNALPETKQCPPQPQPQPYKKDIVRSEHPDFQSFYAAYPKRQSRKTAVKAYERARREGVSHETIMAGLAKAIRSDSRFKDSQFTPLPASWLNAGGYADESNIAPGNRPVHERSLRDLGIV